MVPPLLPRALPGYRHIKRYWDHRNNHCIAKILPGEYYVTRHDEILMTVVGSCVAACIRDSISGIGGMNHFMLPHVSIDRWEHTSVSAANRYGSFAMEHLINDILKHGGQRQNLEVKLFGGGRIMRNMANIGQKNIDFVKKYVQAEGLTLLAEDLGDIYPRKILFFPANGRVRVKKLRAIEQMILQRENAYRRNLENQPIAGDVELF
ncbi:MAG: chemoreceptor glutamine deamidase CheD [Candidatus Parabeggiatoa sp. nov. 1]|nr:MAG: chemoreceptor glutamine deamidase CheD [Gammaproteobacteria bacterium]